MNEGSTVKKEACCVQLYIDRGQGSDEENKRIFDKLHAQQNELENSFGDQLRWSRKDNKRSCTVSFDCDAGGYRSPVDQWNAIHDALIAAMLRFEKTFSPLVKNVLNA